MSNVQCTPSPGDIGGQMGLFIGASILTILELFDYLYEVRSYFDSTKTGMSYFLHGVISALGPFIIRMNIEQFIRKYASF